MILAPTPKVSVIIPTYKHQDYVLQTLDSVFAQTFADYEVIVVNDGSPDRTAAVLRPLAEAGRIVYLEQVNAGQAAARNRGWKEARGEFVAFLDDDDLWPPNKLELQVAEMRRGSPDDVAVVGQCEYFGEETKRPNLPIGRPLLLEQLLLYNSIISPGQSLIRRTALEKIQGFKGIRGGADDWDCWIRLRGLGNILVGDYTSLRYRLHGANASHDHAAMLGSMKNVAVAHTDGSTTPTRSEVLLNMLRYYAKPVVRQSLHCLKRWQIAKAIAGILCLVDCVVASRWNARCGKVVVLAMARVCGSAILSWVEKPVNGMRKRPRNAGSVA